MPFLAMAAGHLSTVFEGAHFVHGRVLVRPSTNICSMLANSQVGESQDFISWAELRVSFLCIAE